MKVLVFPLDMDKVTDFICYANGLSIDVVGASSVMETCGDFNIKSFHKLPFITDDSFEAAFVELLTRHAITHVYTPHGAIWTHLACMKLPADESFKFYLCQPSPYVADWQRLKPSYKWAKDLLGEYFVESLGLPHDVKVRSKLKLGQYASLHKQFVGIPGQCDDLKLLALAHIFRILPEGDLVEIGSFQGRSAFAIGWLARTYKVGNFIGVDPWDIGKVESQGGEADILNEGLSFEREFVDWDNFFWSFISAVSILDNVGYIKDISENAVVEYASACAYGKLVSPEIGEISLTGKIAMLHIDGNHRYDYVCQDIAAWEPWVKPGGWVLLDDYVWAFGDGPKRAGDELLLTGKFDVAFTMSDTLFLRKSK